MKSNQLKNKLLTAVLSAMLIVSSTAGDVFAVAPYSRIKDIADFEGVRTNMLIGYGLVVGLAGTGDAANSIPFTRQTLINMLEKLGVNSKAAEAKLKTKNVAAVMLTAEMPAFARQGSKLDVTISSLGDAKSLEGGQLVASPLLAADGNTYAIAQGPVILGGFVTEGDGGTIAKSHPTSGRIVSGAIIEKETGHELSQNTKLRLMLRNPDFTTAMRVKDVINEAFNEPISITLDNGTIDIMVPKNLRSEMVEIIHKIENLHVRPDTSAKVVIDEKTGTIVMGTGVQISEVAISHANLTIRVTKGGGDMGQADGFSDAVGFGDEAVEEKGKFMVLETGVSLADFIDGLNALGVKPRDVISILQTIKAAGALQAKIVLM